jgi:hypothetical protein
MVVVVDGELLAAEKYVVSNASQSKKVKNWKPPNDSGSCGGVNGCGGRWKSTGSGAMTVPMAHGLRLPSTTDAWKGEVAVSAQT